MQSLFTWLPNSLGTLTFVYYNNVPTLKNVLLLQQVNLLFFYSFSFIANHSEPLLRKKYYHCLGNGITGKSIT